MSRKNDKPTRRYGLTPEESRPKRKRRGHRTNALTTEHELFCQFYAESGNAGGSAVRAGFSFWTGKVLKTRADIQARVAAIKKEYGEQLMEERVEKKILTEQFLDAELMGVIVNGQKKPGQISALRLAYQKENLVAIPGVVINNSNDNKSVAIAGGNFAEVYKSRWLREKEALEAQKLEAEYAEKSRPLLQGSLE